MFKLWVLIHHFDRLEHVDNFLWQVAASLQVYNLIALCSSIISIVAVHSNCWKKKFLVIPMTRWKPLNPCDCILLVANFYYVWKEKRGVLYNYSIFYHDLFNWWRCLRLTTSLKSLWCHWSKLATLSTEVYSWQSNMVLYYYILEVWMNK